MAKKKKKPIQNIKQSRAESYNKFVAGINAILHKLDVDLRAQDLPARVLQHLFLTKHIVPKIVRKQTDSPKSFIFKEIEHFIPLAISRYEIEAEGLGEQILLKTMYTDMLDFSNFILEAFRYKIVKDSETREKLLAFVEAHKSNMKKAGRFVSSIMFTSSYTYSDFTQFINWFEADLKTRSEIKASPYFNIVVNEHKVEQKVFLKGRHNRIGKKVYEIFMDKKPESIGIKLKDLGIGSNKVLDVYLQDHVYDRLYERLDAVDLTTANIELVKSLKKIEYVTNNKNTKLIVYRYLGKKLGYFTFRILDNAILFTTFLFLTNDSTPEGEKLKELTNFEKADKKYLKIDKLSAFAKSDVRDNPKLIKLFEDSGCGLLFEDEYKPFLREVSFNNIAERMLKYLELE